MKQQIHRLSPEEALKNHPIENGVDGWFFSQVEVSNGFYRVEGINLEGRKVSKDGTDPSALLVDVASMAREIQYGISAT